MRQIARGPLGSQLRKTEARASMLQRQSPATIETNGFQSREGEGPRKSLLTMVRELVARMFNYLFEMITRLFADHSSMPAVESRASEPSELRVDPPIGKQPRRQIIVGPRGEPPIKSANVTYKPARLTLSAFFPKEEAAGVTRRARERSSDWSAGTPGSSTTPSSSPRRSTQQISATSQHTHRIDKSPAIGTSENRHLTSSANLNPRMLLTYKSTKKTPE
jgi:hypothetical protein